MDLPGSTYLYTLAALSITFVGFSALVIYLRQTVGGEMSKLDVLIARIFIQLGFIVVAGAMLPPLLSLFGWPHDLIWRTASFVAAALLFFFAATYPARRRAASGVRTPAIVWLDVLILLVAAAVLICNAAGFGLKPSPGPYAAALTAILPWWMVLSSGAEYAAGPPQKPRRQNAARAEVIEASRRAHDPQLSRRILHGSLG